jgi:DNA (cytosine-5)-methyltransferase 1
LPTPKARDSQAEGYEAGLRRATPQVGTIVKGLVEGDDRVLLRSPTASQGEGGALGEQEARKRGNTVGIRDQAMDIAKANGEKVSRALFPTPVAQEGTKAPSQQTSETKSKTGQVWLSNVAKDLEPSLPTPTASDWKGANHSGSGSASTRGIATVVEQTNWGKFEPAIRRWEETIGRPSPAPTKPDGKDGAHRLSSAFTEWLMGLPEGWITDCGLTRNEELKACGNGVVPQQAELALRVLLEGVSIPRGGGQVNLPTPTVSDTFTDNLTSSQQKPGSMHSVTLPQAVRWVTDTIEAGQELSTLDPRTDNQSIGSLKFTAEDRQ